MDRRGFPNGACVDAVVEEDHGKAAGKPAEPAKPREPGKPAAASGDKMDLRPDPNYNGPIPDVLAPPPYWKWFPTARVGDFVELNKGRRSYARYEVVAIEGEKVTVATIVQIEKTKNEVRAHMTFSADQKKQFAAAELPLR